MPNLEFEGWIRSLNWANPKRDVKAEKNILELVQYKYGLLYLKVKFADLHIF